MPVSLAQWRMEIWHFSNYSSKHLLPNILPNIRDIIHKFAFSQFASITLFCIFFILSTSIVYAKFYFSSFLCKVNYTRVYFLRWIISNFFYIALLYVKYYIYIILLCEDVELNPGPKPNSSKCFSICHWNLNITSYKSLFYRFIMQFITLI